MRGGANYGNRMIKMLQGLVGRVSEMKWINIAFLIEDNTSLDLVEEWYNEALAEADKTKKEFELDTPAKFT